MKSVSGTFENSLSTETTGIRNCTFACITHPPAGGPTDNDYWVFHLTFEK